MCRFLLVPAVLATALALADDVPVGPDGKPLYGHSSHGEAFDEGPRQAAVLMPGTGDIDFPVTAKSPEAQKFFNQGVGQLHGFWYYEAERSFRQVAKLDPSCAMAWWGLAMANINNDKRASEFIQGAAKRRGDASPREQLYIDALSAFYAGSRKDNIARRKALVKAMEKLVFEFPDDIEAKAFLAFHLWDHSQKGTPLNSHAALAALIDQVLARNPMHPGAHHYAIHLWNHEDDRRALKSAALCGHSGPGVAHLWHMPGHTFTKLRRYADAAWQQEASARTDHAYMIATRLMPEQIHNYAHNNDWLVENLGFIGRVHDAVDLAKNMIELPRLAPGATRIGRTGYTEERNGFAMGRRRLLAALLDWGHWDELLALDGTMYLPKEDEPLGEATRLRVLGVAAFQKGDTSRGQGALKEIESQIAKAKQERIRKAEDVETQAKKDRKSEDEVVKATAESLKAGSKQIEQIEKLANELRAYAALASGSRDEARTRIEKAGEISKVRLSQFQLALGDGAKAMETARAAQKQAEDQVLPLANLAEILWKNGKKQEAIDAFHKLRPLSANADTGEPALARLRPIADELHLPADWRPKPAQAADTGKRPDLASLGPFRWHPYEAPAWTLEDDNGATRSLAEFKGQPVLVVFYLGSGCSHCIEQLNTFSPMTKDFRDAGISIVAVSTEPPDELHKTFAKAIGETGFPFPILADPKLAAFKAYRAFDDFENMPLHGTFLIDGAGLVRWQDISYRPFTQAKWLLGEAKRLLALPQTATAKALSSSGARVPGPQRSALSAESDSRSKN